MKMVVVVVVGSGDVRRLFMVLKTGEELKHDSKMLIATSLPPSLCVNQFLLCFFVIWGQLGGFGIIFMSRSAAAAGFSSVMFSSLARR